MVFGLKKKNERVRSRSLKLFNGLLDRWCLRPGSYQHLSFISRNSDLRVDSNLLMNSKIYNNRVSPILTNGPAFHVWFSRSCSTSGVFGDEDRSAESRPSVAHELCVAIWLDVQKTESAFGIWQEYLLRFTVALDWSASWVIFLHLWSTNTDHWLLFAIMIVIKSSH